MFSKVLWNPLGWGPFQGVVLALPITILLVKGFPKISQFLGEDVKRQEIHKLRTSPTTPLPRGCFLTPGGMPGHGRNCAIPVLTLQFQKTTVKVHHF